MKLTHLILFLALIALFSCKESEDITPEENPLIGHLTTGEWLRVKYELNGSSVWDIFPACAKDDPMGYNADGTAYIDQGLLLCDSTFPQRTSWTWEFNNDQSQLLDHVNDSTTYIRHIRVLTADEFEYVSYNGQDSLVSGFAKR